MHLLIDTPLYLWWLKDDKALSHKARDLISEAEEVYVSAASLWEATLKIQQGKLNASIESLVSAIKSEGFIELAVTAKHIAMLAKLPEQLRDPIDRVLLAQAMAEPLRFVTANKKLRKYSDLVEFV